MKKEITYSTDFANLTIEVEVPEELKDRPDEEIPIQDGTLIRVDLNNLYYSAADFMPSLVSTYSGIRTIQVPEGISRLDARSCANIRARVEIVLPKSLKEIGTDAFRGSTGLQKISLPEGLEVIADRAFDGCKDLVEVDLQTSALQVIGCNAFEGCVRLKDLKLPPSLKKIGSQAFAECESLSKIVFPNECSLGEDIFLNTARSKVLFFSEDIGAIDQNAFNGFNVNGIFANKAVQEKILSSVNESEKGAIVKAFLNTSFSELYFTSGDQVVMPDNLAYVHQLVRVKEKAQVGVSKPEDPSTVFRSLKENHMSIIPEDYVKNECFLLKGVDGDYRLVSQGELVTIKDNYVYILGEEDRVYIEQTMGYSKEVIKTMHEMIDGQIQAGKSVDDVNQFMNGLISGLR